MFCPQCGVTNVDNAVVCAQCGRNLQTGTTGAPTPLAVKRRPHWPLQVL